MSLALQIVIGVLAAGTVGFFIFMAAAEVTRNRRRREQARFTAEVKAAQAEARQAVRLRGRVPNDKWAA